MASREKTGPKGAKQGKPPPDRTGHAPVAPAKPVPRTLEEERYRLALESINHGHYDWEIDQQHDLLLGDACARSSAWRRDSTSRPRSRPSGCIPTISRITARRWSRISRARRRASLPSTAISTITTSGAGRARAASRCAGRTATPTAWSARRSTSPRTSCGSRSSRRRAPRSSRRARSCAPFSKT